MTTIFLNDLANSENATVASNIYTLTADYDVLSGKTLQIEPGETLVILRNKILTNKGTINNNGGTITNNGGTINNIEEAQSTTRAQSTTWA